jgi:lysophospholipase L1-like esterase
MKNWLLGLSVILNLILLGVLVFLNARYGLWAKVQRVALVEERVPGIAASYELNREYQVRREMFRLDKNESARVLMLGDSLTAQGEWNAMLGEPLVANRGIDGDTSAGLLARIGDDADFGGDAVVIWIGTNDVLQGRATAEVVGNVKKAVAGLRDNRTTGRQGGEEKAEHPRDSAEPKGETNVWPREGNRSEAEQKLKSEKLKKKKLTTKNTNRHETGKIIEGKIIGTTEEETGLRLAGQAGASESDSLASELADSPVSESLISSADGPALAAEPPRTDSGGRRTDPAGIKKQDSTGQDGGGRVAPEIEGTTKGTKGHEIGKIIDGKIIGTTEEETGLRLAGQAGASESDSLPSELADSPVSESLISSADGPASALDSGHSTLDTVPEAPKIFVLGVAPLARWWEGARERNAVIREINARLAEGAWENGYRFIELESVLADENGFLRGELTSDGVHLSAKGYVEVIQRLKEVGLWPAAEG